MSNDVAPGDAQQHDVASSVRSYLIGLFLAGALTAASFWTLSTPYLWAPGIGVALAALAIAQMGVHLVFFLKITTGPDNTNNVLALAFGVLIVTLLVGGSLWIMANLDRHHDMGTAESVSEMYRAAPGVLASRRDGIAVWAPDVSNFLDATMR